MLKEEVRQRPHDATAWLDLGMAALAEGDVDEARVALDRAATLAAAGADVELSRRLAGALGQIGDTAGSVRFWRKVVALTGAGDKAALTNLGIALSSDAQHGEAIGVLTEVAGARDATSADHANLGMALLAAEKFEQAEGVFLRAREMDWESPQSHCGLGLVYQQRQRWWEAADAFRTAERLAPDSPVVLLNLGLVLERLGDHPGAAAVVARAAELAPDDTEIKAMLERLGRPDPDDIDTPTMRIDDLRNEETRRVPALPPPTPRRPTGG